MIVISRGCGPLQQIGPGDKTPAAGKPENADPFGAGFVGLSRKVLTFQTA
jgi:hypothetical protein